MLSYPKIDKDIKIIHALSELGLDKNSRILAVFPHPDDETGFCAGFLQKSSSENIPLRLICATKGEKGNALWKQVPEKQLAEIRVKELGCALGVYGVTDYEILDFNDGKLEQQYPQLKKKLIEVIESYKPTHILSLEPWGIYGHPDHIALSKAATELAVGFGNIKLIYATVTNSEFFKRVRDEMAKNPNSIRPLNPNYALKLSSKEISGKVRGFSCHKSQFKLRFAFFFKWFGRGLLSYEFYVS